MTEKKAAARAKETKAAVRGEGREGGGGKGGATQQKKGRRRDSFFGSTYQYEPRYLAKRTRTYYVVLYTNSFSPTTCACGY